ncbi:MAG: transcriptional coactivator PipX [Chroococcales cyanobacterium]
MNTETYLNHPTFGLLYRVCLIEQNQELFTTLYAQRLFFLALSGIDGLRFEPVTRAHARLLVETRLRLLRRMGQTQEFAELQLIHKRTFQ